VTRAFAVRLDPVVGSRRVVPGTAVLHVLLGLLADRDVPDGELQIGGRVACAMPLRAGLARPAFGGTHAVPGLQYHEIALLGADPDVTVWAVCVRVDVAGARWLSQPLRIASDPEYYFVSGMGAPDVRSLILALPPLI